MANTHRIPLVDLGRNNEQVGAEAMARIADVVEQSDYINGAKVAQFETQFAAYTQSRFCIGVANGTDALEIAVRALELPPGSEIITQGNTFAATAFSISNNGHVLRVADVSPDTFMIDVDSARSLINEKTTRIIPVHLYGHAAPMDQVMELAREFNLHVIEDCAQAHGCLYKGSPVGSFGTLACYSFYPGKNLGAFGDAGGITTNDERLAVKIRKMRNLGSERKYHHEMVGRNSRMDTIQAAVLSVKLDRLDTWNGKRRQLASLYQTLLEQAKELSFQTIKECQPVYHLFVVRLPTTVLRDSLFAYLKDKGVSCGLHYPVSIVNMGCYRGALQDRTPVSERLASTLLSLPMFPELREHEVEYICQCVGAFFREHGPERAA